jgi:hypothetical protein
MQNPVALIASTLEAVAALSMSVVRSLLYFLAKPTTASLVISRNKNPVIPFVIFQSLTLFPLVIMANVDPNEMDSLKSIVPLIERIKISDLGFAIVYFFISYPLVNLVSYTLKKKKYVFRSVTRAVQNLYGFTLFVVVGGTTVALPFVRQFLVYQEESSLIVHPNFLNFVISSGVSVLAIIFVGSICYRLIYRSKTQILNWVAAIGGSALFVGIFFLSLASSTYLYLPIRHAKYLVESFKCIANDKDLNVRVVLKNDSDKSVFIDQFIVLVKDSSVLSNDVAEGHWATVFKVGKEGKQERGVVVFPDERVLLSFDIEFSDSGDLKGKSCALPLNPSRAQGTGSDWQDIVVRRPEQESFEGQGRK